MAGALPSNWLERVARSLSDHEERRDSLQNFPPRYEVLDEISRGGMGIVYRAWDPQLGRNVALKVLRSEDGSAAEAHERFQREARLAAGLHHPHIVPVYDTGTWNGQDYIAMQLIDGVTLEQAKPDRRTALACIRDAARALQYAHEQGIVHRDVKPSNLMLDAQGRLFIMDFGIARQAVSTSGMTSPGTVVGTPAYMSPEQAQGLPLDARSDVYSLGATLYELVTGRAPYQGQPLEVVEAVRTKDPDSARRLVGDLSKNVAAIISGAMERRAQDRYPSAAALADDIERYLKGERPHRRPRGLSYKVQREFVRHPWRSAASIVFCLLLFLAGTMVGFGIRAYVYLKKGHRETSLDLRKKDFKIAEPWFAEAGRELARIKEFEDDQARTSAQAVLEQAHRLAEFQLQQQKERDQQAIDASNAATQMEQRKTRIAQLEKNISDFLGEGNLEEARKALDELVTLAPEKKSELQPRFRKLEFQTGLSRLKQLVPKLEGPTFDKLLDNLSEPPYASQKDRNSELSKIAYARATALKDVGRLPEALKMLERAESLNFNEARLYETEGLILIQLGEWDRADGVFSQLMQRSAVGTAYPLPFAELPYRRGHQALQEGKWGRAIEQFEIALYIDKKHALALHDRGLARFRSTGQSREALEQDLKAALDVRPDLQPDAGYREVAVHYARGRSEEAWTLEDAAQRLSAWRSIQTWLNVITRKTGGNADLRMEAAKLSRRLLDFDAALTHLSGLEETADLLLLRGELLYGKAFERGKDVEKLKLAFADLDRAVELSTTKGRALYWRGTCRYSLGERGNAKADLEAARSQGVEFSDLHYQLSRLHLEAKEYPNAVEQASAALSLSSALTEDEYVSNLFEGKGQSRAAGIRILERDILLCRALARFYQLDFKSSVTDCTRIIEANPQFFKAVVLRGDAYCQEKRHPDAQKDYVAAISIAITKDERELAAQRKASCEGHTKE